ncbi:MAG: hypothetical protein Q8R53_05085, partial [Nanoarchaeota archaeon]|nr:hypothetical protein [Nanoarchaeota archaeon]
MSKTLEACLRENTAQEVERRLRIATLTQQEEHLQSALQRIREQHQTALAEQAQAPSAEDLYWSQMEASAKQLQERSEALAGWKSTAAQDQQLIAVYEANRNHPDISSSLKGAYEAAQQRRAVIGEPVVAEIALKMHPFGDGESYLLTLPVPTDAEEGLLGEIRSSVMDTLEKNGTRVKKNRKHNLQSYILLSPNPRCHPEKLKELL